MFASILTVTEMYKYIHVIIMLDCVLQKVSESKIRNRIVIYFNINEKLNYHETNIDMDPSILVIDKCILIVIQKQ